MIRTYAYVPTSIGCDSCKGEGKGEGKMARGGREDITISSDVPFRQLSDIENVSDAHVLAAFQYVA